MSEQFQTAIGTLIKPTMTEQQVLIVFQLIKDHYATTNEPVPETILDTISQLCN
jgi:hypothetical protein